MRRPRAVVPMLARRRAFGVRRGGSLCGGCASACLVIVVIVALLVFLFWREVNSAIRGIYPGWPLLLALPILLYAYPRPIREHPDRQFSPQLVRSYLASLLRASIAVPFGRKTFRLYLFCHGMPERCFTIRGRTFPICARCTGLLIGLAAGFLVPAAGYLGSIAGIGLASLLAAPLLLDGFTQLVGLRQSTNPLRVVSGVIGGVGLAFGTQVLRLVLIGS